MKIHINRFVTKNPDLTFDDVVQNLKVGVTKEGVVNVWFETRDKYVEVNAHGGIYTPEYSGTVIELHPYLYTDDGASIERGDDAYYEDPDYWYATLVVESTGHSWNPIVIPLKHEYFVSFVPDSMVMNRECLEEAELIEWVEK